VQLESDRVILREFSLDDVAEWQGFFADPRYLEFYAPEVGDPKFAKDLVDLFVRTATAKPRRDYTLAVVERLSSRLIGCCSLRTAGQKAGCAEFGMGLSPEFWGRGFAAEAAREMLRFGFETLHLDEIRGQSVTANHRVANLVTKLGFVKLGEPDGAPWMVARGWTHTLWALTKSTWVR
jgi:RimJ/RimL family protein N-acetyltransferase